MNLKQYTHQPDPGLFDTIQRRLRRRRAFRRGGVAVGAVALLGVATLFFANRTAVREEAPQVAAWQPSVQAAPPTAATTQPTDVQPMVAMQSHAVAAPATAPSSTVAIRPAAQSQPVADVSTAMTQPQAQPATSAATAVAEHPAAVPVSAPATNPAAGHEAVAATKAESPAPAVAAIPPAPKSEVESDGVEVWAPNIIVPDGDVDENRTFGLRFTTEVSDFKLYVFNRNGRQLVYSNDPHYRWDGTCNGSRLPQGAYVWVVQFRDSEGRPVQKKGTVTLLR